MNEIWKDIKGFEGIYQVSCQGNVKSVSRKRRHGRGFLVQKEIILKLGLTHQGYQRVSLGTKKSNKVHRLVAEAFIPNPDNKPYVNHKDGNKANNHIDYLEWVTPLENNLHCYRVLHKSPSQGFMYDKNKKSKKVEQYYVSEEGYSYKLATYANAAAASKINGIGVRCIALCCSGKCAQAGGYIWRYVVG